MEHEPIRTIEPAPDQVGEPTSIPEEPIDEEVLDTEILDEFDNAETNNENTSEPFEYFVDFDEPIGEPLTDDDLYN